MSPGARGIHGPRAPLALICVCAAGLVLASCTRLAEAYRTYDAHVNRELVAGRDAQRGDYVEFRISPRAPRPVGSAGDGKAVAR